MQDSQLGNRYLQHLRLVPWKSCDTEGNSRSKVTAHQRFCVGKSPNVSLGKEQTSICSFELCCQHSQARKPLVISEHRLSWESQTVLDQHSLELIGQNIVSCDGCVRRTILDCAQFMFSSCLHNHGETIEMEGLLSWHFGKGLGVHW